MSEGGVMLILLVWVMPLVVFAVLGLAPQRWAQHLAAWILLVVAGASLAFLLVFMAYVIYPVNRVTFWLAATDVWGTLCFAAYWIYLLIGLVLWLLGGVGFRSFYGKDTLVARRRVVVLYILVAFVITVPVATYLRTYRTLEETVREGNLELTRKRLSFNLLGVDANNGCICKHSDGVTQETLLTIPIRAGDQAMVQLLIDSGADVNLSGRFFGDYPLLTALRSGDVDMVRLLVENDAELDPFLALNRHELKRIAEAGHQDAIDYLREIAEERREDRETRKAGSESGEDAGGQDSGRNATTP